MYRNILIIKLSAIGDVIHALPMAPAIKQTYPEAKVTWVVEKTAYDLLTNNPYIDEIIVFEKKKFKTLIGFFKYTPAFSRMLKTKKFDLALDLQGLAKSAAIAYLSGAKAKLGYCNMREYSHLVSKPVCGPHSQEHVVQRYLDVARAIGCKADEVIFPVVITKQESQRAVNIAKFCGLDISCPYIILAPGANWPNKRWPTEHFAALADMIFAKNKIPVLIGAKADEYFAEEIISAARIPPVNLVGKTTLKELAYIIKQAQAFVGGDTGPMHLAVAVGTPVVALFGPTDAKRNGPYGDKNIVLNIDADCAGCWQRACPKSLDCLKAISAEAVYSKLDGVI